MGYSITKHQYDGSSTEFPVNFVMGFLSRSHIAVYVTGKKDSLGNQLYSNFEWIDDSRIRVTDTLQINDEINIERTVPKDNLIFDVSAQGGASRENLAACLKQSMMANQEVLDGRSEPVSGGSSAIINTMQQFQRMQAIIDAAATTSSQQVVMDVRSVLKTGSVFIMNGASYRLDETARSAQGAPYDYARPVEPIVPAHYGITGSGDETAKLQKMTQYAAERGEVVDFQDKTIEFSEINVTGSRAIWKRGNLKSNKTTRTGITFHSDCAIQFKSAATNAVTSLTADAEMGSNELTLASTAGIAVGDILIVKSTRLIPTDHRGGWTEGQAVRVSSVVGNKVLLESTLDYTAKAAQVTTGTVTSRVSDYKLTLSTLPANLRGRDTKIALEITSGASAGTIKYVVGMNSTTKVARTSGGEAGETDRGAWPADVQAGTTYSYKWVTTVEVCKPIEVQLEDMQITRNREVTATSGNYGFRGVRIVCANEPSVVRCKFDGFSETNLHLSKCYAPRVDHSIFNYANLAYDQWKGTGYGISVETCASPVVTNVSGIGCRRLVDFSGADGYTNRGVCDNAVMYGGGTGYSGQVMFPQGTVRQNVCGSHGSGLLSQYMNCKAVDTYGGVTLRGVSERVYNFNHYGAGYSVVQIYDGGTGHQLNNINYNDKFSEVGAAATHRYQPVSDPSKRVHRMFTIDYDSLYADAMPITISEFTANALVECAVYTQCSSTGTVRNLVVQDGTVRASAEGTSVTDFRMVMSGVDTKIDECRFDNLNFDVDDTYTGSAAVLDLVYDSGSKQAHYSVATGGKIRIDRAWYVTLGNNSVSSIPFSGRVCVVDLYNILPGNRQYAMDLMINSGSSTIRSVNPHVLNVEVLASKPTNGSGVSSGKIGVNLDLASGKFTVANNVGSTQNYKISLK